MGWTEERIRKYAESFLQETYGVALTVPIRFNNRLRRALGIVRFDGWKPVSLEFHTKFIQTGDEDDIIKVIKHECIHFAMFVLARPYHDGDEYFEKELRKQDAAITNSIQFATKQNVRVYSCGCREYVRYRMLKRTYVCTACGNQLEYVRTEQRYT